MPEVELEDRMIGIELPDKYWIIVLGALEHVVKQATARIEQMMDEGLDLDALGKLPKEQITVLTGPMIARAMIVDALVNAGVMKSEAAEWAGTKAVWRMIQDFQSYRTNPNRKP